MIASKVHILQNSRNACRAIRRSAAVLPSTTTIPAGCGSHSSGDSGDVRMLSTTSSLSSLLSSSTTTTTNVTTTISVPTRRHVHIERRLQEMGMVLPKPAGPRANYSPVMRVGDMLYVSGHLPFDVDGNLKTGKIYDSDDNSNDGHPDLQHGYDAARLCGMNIISTVQSYLDGDLDRVVKVVKLFGIVQSDDKFKSQHLVMDGCSDVMMKVFGEDVGLHARSAIGTSTLPLDMSVEVEAIFQIRD